ncbi:MAG: hypothetical protein KY443_12245, partial [Actinobacteria bacterium]|nr:hypothetical protein [Actinomycetota bacterium]
MTDGTRTPDSLDAELVPLFTGVSAPRPVPAHLRERLESALVGEAAGGGGLAFTDGPRPLPHDMRDRIEVAVLAATPVRAMPWAVRRRLESTLARPRR